MLTNVLLGKSEPSFQRNQNEIRFYDDTLNDTQKDAVKHCLLANEVALVHGPVCTYFLIFQKAQHRRCFHLKSSSLIYPAQPGTGKTHTMVEVIRQLVKRGERILVCGPSNISVGAKHLVKACTICSTFQLYSYFHLRHTLCTDNVLERLSKCKVRVLRLGHPARVLPGIVQYTLDAQVRSCPEGRIVADVMKEIDEKLAMTKKSRNRTERRQLYGDIKELRKELRLREKNVIRNLIKGAAVVLSTLNGAAGHNLRDDFFDVLVVDECGQALGEI
jgi:DNA polymerase alpha-associated DNA helicase A